MPINLFGTKFSNFAIITRQRDNGDMDVLLGVNREGGPNTLDRYGLPGGGMEWGDIWPALRRGWHWRAQGAVRETLEETGLAIRPVKKVCHLRFRQTETGRSFNQVYFRAELMGGSIRDSEEFGSISFVPIAQLPDMVENMNYASRTALIRAGLLDSGYDASDQLPGLVVA